MVGTSYSGNYLRNARNPSDFVKYQRKLIDNRFKSTKFASTLTSRVKSKTPLLNNHSHLYTYDSADYSLRLDL